MLFHRVILVLLCWPCARAADTADDVTDQIATASENFATSLAALRGPEAASDDAATTVHYENANGFVPMTSYAPQQSNSSREARTAANFPTKLEMDPAFSASARFLLTLPRSGPDRRFDSDQSQFEILKVNNETPAIANYHEFYENLQSNLHPDDKGFSRNTSNMKTRDRIRMIDEYLNYDADHQSGSANYPPQYQHYAQHAAVQKTSMFEPEKVHSGFQDIYGESVTRQRASHPNFEVKALKRQQTKPLIIVEPSDYKVNLKYDQQSSVAKVSTTDSYASQKRQKDISEDRYDRKEDYSDESSDYLEITERPRRTHKSRRRPHASEVSRKLPKEHRNERDSEDAKKVTSSRTKSHRGRAKPTYWHEETSQSFEDTSEEQKKNQEVVTSPGNAENQNKGNSWSQVAPNVEFSQSNGFEINQVDNQNLLVPVNLNLVPFPSFNHSSALGGNQWFDAGLSNFVSATPIVTSTAAPLVSTSLPLQTQTKSYGFSNPVPDIIVGQNTFQNPVQAVLLPQMNKFVPSVKPPYLASTMAPMFTFTQPTVQSITTPMPKLTSSVSPQLFVPQSTLHTFIQTPVNPANNYNIFVNPRGLHGQTVQSTTPSPVASYGDNQGKRGYSSNGQILTSASFSVGQEAQSNQGHNKYLLSPSNANNYYANQNNQLLKPQLQATLSPSQMVPALIPAVNLQQPQAPLLQPTYLTQYPKTQNQQQVVNVANNIFENTWRQLQQLQTNDPQRNRYQSFYNVDSLGSTSNTNANTVNTINAANNVRNGNGAERAQLPVVGMQTVEIRNPNINIKPSPVDLTVVNPYETISQYPAAILTTPIPILTTPAGFLTPRPILTTTTPESISIQSYVDQLTQIGSQSNPVPINNQQTFNPMNFVPNYDVVKSQSMLNSRVHVPKPLPQHLSLVPLVAGGNFDKHSPTAQVDLVTKPKLAADLEKYAEEMFKESLKTIYNTHKWNSDKKVRNLTEADIAELERLKAELGRFRAALAANAGHDVLEAHHSETKLRTAEPSRPTNSGLSISTIEELFKSDLKVKGQETFASRPHDETKLSDYLTPPRLSYKKKRPSTKGRYEKRPHRPSRPGPEGAASNHVVYHRRPYHERTHKQPKYDSYPTFTTSAPNGEVYQIVHDDGFRREFLDVNHPRTHNLLGLLMKNKQLPRGANPVYTDEDGVNEYLEEQRRRAEQQFQRDLTGFGKRADPSSSSRPRV